MQATCLKHPETPSCARGGLHMRRLRLLDRRGTAQPVPGLRPPHGRGRSSGGECIEGDNGVKANAAQIVAWWCAEDAAELSRGVCGECPRHAPVLRPGRDARSLSTTISQKRGGTRHG